VIAEVVISDYWTERIELLFMFVGGVTLGVLFRMIWEHGR
jgi:hypothetical protein